MWNCCGEKYFRCLSFWDCYYYYYYYFHEMANHELEFVSYLMTSFFFFFWPKLSHNPIFPIQTKCCCLFLFSPKPFKIIYCTIMRLALFPSETTFSDLCINKFSMAYFHLSVSVHPSCPRMTTLPFQHSQSYQENKNFTCESHINNTFNALFAWQ